MARELIDIEAARQMVLERVPPLVAEHAALDDALGRVLAADVSSADAIPPFDNSAMDGYAVQSADARGAAPDAPVTLRLVGESRAGAPATVTPAPGEAVAISTGAQIPAACDAVVRLEHAERRDSSISVAEPVEPGHDVGRAGDDIRAGDTVLRRGAILGAAELGVLASVGRAEVQCVHRPRAAVLTTGDELVTPADPLGPGKIRDTNAHSIPALVRASGAELLRVGRAGDDAASTREGITPLLEANVAVICGGVSVGEHDHVRPVLAKLGVEQVFWGLALRPGRPTWFGVAPSGALVYGLPGNPVSAIVTFILLVRPALLALTGASPRRRRASAVLDARYEKQPGRAHLVRVRLGVGDDGWHARPTKQQGSHVLTSMIGADAFAIIPTEHGDVEAGERVEIEFLPIPGPAA